MEQFIFSTLAYIHDAQYDAILMASTVYCSNKDSWDFFFLLAALCCIVLPAQIRKHGNFFLLELYLTIFPIIYALQRFYVLRFYRFTPEVLQGKTFYAFIQCSFFIFFWFFVVGLLVILCYYVILNRQVFKDKKN